MATSGPASTTNAKCMAPGAGPEEGAIPSTRAHVLGFDRRWGTDMCNGRVATDSEGAHGLRTGLALGTVLPGTVPRRLDEVLFVWPPVFEVTETRHLPAVGGSHPRVGGGHCGPTDADADSLGLPPLQYTRAGLQTSSDTTELRV